MDYMDIFPAAAILIIGLGPVLCFGALAITHDLKRPPQRQFSVRDALVYIALSAVCFSPFGVSPMDRSCFALEKDWVVLSSWLLLATFYLRGGHLTSPVAHGVSVWFTGLLIGSVALFTVILPFDMNWDIVGMRISQAMFLGSFFGLAIFSVMAVAGLLRNEPS
ncbi:MAG: hypothetical protein ABFC96_03620 [Thermoguttaceae bacterium]